MIKMDSFNVLFHTSAFLYMIFANPNIYPHRAQNKTCFEIKGDNMRLRMKLKVESGCLGKMKL